MWTPQVGYVVTEFLPNVSWAGAFNTIVASAGHHIYEGRWLRDHAVMDDYTRFWLSGWARTHEYTSWLANAVLARYTDHIGTMLSTQAFQSLQGLLFSSCYSS